MAIARKLTEAETLRVTMRDMLEVLERQEFTAQIEILEHLETYIKARRKRFIERLEASKTLQPNA